MWLGRKYRVALDGDGVVVMDQTSRFITFCQEVLHWTFDEENFGQTHNLYTALQQGKSQVDVAHERFAMEAALPLQLSPGALEGIMELREIADLCVITARKGISIRPLRALLDQHGLGAMEIFGGHGRQKYVPINALRIAVHMDDACSEVGPIIDNCKARVIQFPYLACSNQLPHQHERVHPVGMHLVNTAAHETILASAWEAAVRLIHDLKHFHT